MAKLTDKQIAVVEHDEGNILVTASAGSGKTHTMIERVKRLILQKNVNVSEILCATFTEAAASDMKSKLKNALSERAKFDDSGRVLTQLAQVDGADISTLHSFCAKLIRTYFYEVGVSPDFKIMDDNESDYLRAECMEKTLREFYDLGGDWFYKLVDRHSEKRTDKSLRELLFDLFDFCESEADPLSFMQKFEYYYSKEGQELVEKEHKKHIDEKLKDILEQLEDDLLGLKAIDYKKGAEYTEYLISVIKSTLENPDLYCIKSLEKVKDLSFGKNLDEVVAEYKNSVQALKKEYTELIKEYASILTDRESANAISERVNIHTKNLMRVLERFCEVYANAKMEDNLLDFADLEHFALKILQNEQILSDVRAKYKYIFVDEYQDTNGVQEAIISLLSSNNVFMVGDVKQSIYGFRGCRPEFFMNKISAMRKSGQRVVELNHNFRSADNVIDMANKIFSFCMTERFFGENYAKTSKLIAGGLYPEDKKGRAEVHFLQKQKKEKTEREERIYDVLEQLKSVEQENNLATMVTGIISDELGKKYYDLKTGEYKNVTYGDIAILVRKKKNEKVETLVKDLIRHGIPVSSEVRENVCDYPEIALMINVLNLIDCFSQDIPLASTLKSPIGKFLDEELVQIVEYYDQNQSDKPENWGFYHAYRFYLENATGELKDRLFAFDKYFEKIRFLSDFIGAFGVLDKIIKENRIENYLLSTRLGKTKAGRLRRFVKASVVNGKMLTVKDFLFKIENSPDSFGFAECGEEDSVRVMTIHASKGLEFPVVIVCGLENRLKNVREDSSDVYKSREFGIVLKDYDDDKRLKTDTLLRKLTKLRMNDERIREEMRLFYVAATRATYSMHLTFEGDEDKRVSKFKGAKNFFDYVPQGIPATMHYPEQLEFDALRNESRPIVVAKQNQALEQKIKENLGFSYKYQSDITLPLKSSVTGALKDTEEEQLVHVLFDEPSPDKERGTIAHKILEYFDFSKPNEFSVQVENMVKANVLSQDQVDKINLARLKNAVLESALKDLGGYKLYREKDFIVGIPASMLFDTDSQELIVVQGIIDLLAINEDGAKIIDYKYSSLDTESLKKHYKLQLDIYAYAVEKVLGKPVISKTLVNIFTGESIDV